MKKSNFGLHFMCYVVYDTPIFFFQFNNEDYYSSSTEDLKRAIFRIITYALSFFFPFVATATNVCEHTKLYRYKTTNPKIVLGKISQCKA